MAKRNYNYEKRKREMAKQKKREEKRLRKLAKRNKAEEGSGESPEPEGEDAVETPDEATE